MSSPKIAVIFYSTYGTNHQVAQAAATSAAEAGAEVRLRRIAETAPREVVEGQDAWRTQLDKMQDIAEVAPEDMEWADGFFLSAPTRFGSAPSQMRAFIDTLGPLWAKGALSGKTATATTSASNTHGGQEATILSLYTTLMHWGSVIVAPGYADESIGKAGGNPYGYSAMGGGFDDAGRAAVAFQARRLVEVTAKLIV